MIEVRETAIEGLLLFEPKVFHDNRGFFFESWRKNTYRKLGIDEELVQDDISFSQKDVLRGLHVHMQQGQLLTILAGIVFDVVVDLRPQSKTYKQFLSFTLSGEKPQQIYMPPGTAHGFCVLSDSALLHYKCSQYYDPKAESGIRWDDPTLAIPWPVKKPALSERDQHFPPLSGTLLNG